MTNITVGNSATLGQEVKWSPCGTYLAVVGKNLLVPNDNEFQIYRFDGYRCKFLASADFGTPSSQVWSVSWHPTGKYVAISGSTAANLLEIKVYRFDGSSLTLIKELDFVSGDQIAIVVEWSSDGRYLGVGGAPGAGNSEVLIYDFVNEDLSLVTSFNFGTQAGAQVQTLSWANNNTYLAIGGFGRDVTPAFGQELLICSFDGTSLTVTGSADWPDTSTPIVAFNVLYDVFNSGNRYRSTLCH